MIRGGGGRGGAEEREKGAYHCNRENDNIETHLQTCFTSLRGDSTHITSDWSGVCI